MNVPNEAPASIYLRALWYDYHGDWNEAHELIQDLKDPKAAWIHAYLHRKEGDEWNARYWYSSAKRPFPMASLKQEWKEIWSELFQSEEAAESKD